MKINKLFAGISAAAIAATMCSFSTSAVAEGAASIDFEDGDCSFVYMNVDDAGSDESVLSVADYEGSKQLKIDVQDSTKVPKVWFDLYKIMPKDSVPSITSMEFDLTIVPKDSSKHRRTPHGLPATGHATITTSMLTAALLRFTLREHSF